MVQYIEDLALNRNFDIAVVVLDGGPGCGKSAMMSFIMTRMRHLFTKVRLITEKLITLEDHHKTLCPAHLQRHVGLAAEKYAKSSHMLESIMSCTVSKIIYDIMGAKSSDGERTRDIKRDSNDVINNINSYRSEIESLLEMYLHKFKVYPAPSDRKQLHLYIIDEYAMIPPEKIYFIIAYLHRRDPSSHHVFILSGDVDQVEPIGHEAECKASVDGSRFAESWFPVGMCNDVNVVCKSLGLGYRCVIDKFALTEPARCMGDTTMVDFIKHYKTCEDKELVLGRFVSHNMHAVLNVCEVPVDTGRVDMYLNGSADYVNLGFKIIARSNKCVSSVVDALTDGIAKRYPEITYRTTGGDNFVIGMPYTLLKTLDPGKILCNRSIVVLDAVNINAVTGAIDTIVVYSITDEEKYKYIIGPERGDNGPRFPIQMEFADNSYQIQGKTIRRDLYLDMLNCSKEHRYVMLTRATVLTQIKSVLNFV